MSKDVFSLAHQSLMVAEIEPYKGQGGLTLIPIDGKRPIHRDWPQRKYNSEKVLANCVAEGRNVGCRLSDTWLVIDIDLRSGGTEGFKNLCLHFGLDPQTWPCVITGSGGRHYYLRKPAGKIMDALPDFGGVEFKSGIGRQVAAAGSFHNEAKRHYEWEIGTPSLADAPQCPPKLLEAILRPALAEGTDGGQYSQEQIANALDKLDVTEFRDHDKWLRLMMAVHHASNGDTRDEWVEWSTSDPKYANQAEIIGRRWDSLHKSKPGGITFRTLNKILAEHGAANAQAAADVTDDEFDPLTDEDLANVGKEARKAVLDYKIADTITPKKISWLWKGRIPRGKVTLIAGFPNQGKSQITLAIAAAVTTGGQWPNAEGNAQRGAVFIMSSEDTADDTIIPRLKAAGADMSQVIIVEPMVMETVNGRKRERVFNLGDDMRKLEAVMAAERAKGRDARLIIFDPLNAYFGGPDKADSHKSADMRALLTPLATWAGLSDVTIIGITHLNKGGNAHTLYRITDSGAITAVARAVWFAVRDEESGRFMILSGKNNLARDLGGLAYEIEEADIGGGIKAPRIAWGGPVSITAEQALGERKERNPDALSDAKEWLDDYLSNGPRPAKQLLIDGRAHGHSTKTLQRAKKELGVQSSKEGFEESGWHWHLSSHVPADEFERSEL